MRIKDEDPRLRGLPEALRAYMHTFPNGEVAWPNSAAEAAINALADAGHLISGLDARTLRTGGAVSEVPISAWSPIAGEDDQASVERARREATAALTSAAEEGTPVLISW